MCHCAQAFYDGYRWALSDPAIPASLNVALGDHVTINVGTCSIPIGSSVTPQVVAQYHHVMMAILQRNQHVLPFGLVYCSLAEMLGYAASFEETINDTYPSAAAADAPASPEDHSSGSDFSGRDQTASISPFSALRTAFLSVPARLQLQWRLQQAGYRSCFAGILDFNVFFGPFQLHESHPAVDHECWGIHWPAKKNSVAQQDMDNSFASFVAAALDQSITALHEDSSFSETSYRYGHWAHTKY